MFNHGSWFDDGFWFEASTNSVEDVAFALSSGSHCSCFLISRDAFQDTGRFQFAFKKMHAVPEYLVFISRNTDMLRTTMDHLHLHTWVVSPLPMATANLLTSKAWCSGCCLRSQDFYGTFRVTCAIDSIDFWWFLSHHVWLAIESTCLFVIYW